MKRETYAAARGIVAALLLATALPLAAQEPTLSPGQRAQGLVNLARLELSARNYPLCLELLTQAAALQPGWLVPNQWMALAYQQSDDREHALQQYVLLQKSTVTAGPSGCRRANPAGTEDLIASMEALELWLINETREQQGLALLRLEPRLSLVAREHSLEMRDLGFFDHLSPTEAMATPLDRVRVVFQFYPKLVAENLARRWGDGPCLDAERLASTHQDLLNSPAHRDNLLTTQAECVGVGLATNASNAYWLTQLFARFGNGDQG